MHAHVQLHTIYMCKPTSMSTYLAVLVSVHRKSEYVVEPLADKVGGRALEELGEGAAATRRVVLVQHHDLHLKLARGANLNRREHMLYVYVYIYIYIYIYTYIYLCVYAYLYIHVYMHVYMHLYLYLYSREASRFASRIDARPAPT